MLWLSSKSVSKHYNINNSNEIKRCAMPYDGSAITEGRKVICDLVRNRTFDNWSCQRNWKNGGLLL